MADVLVVDAGELGELLATLFEQYGLKAVHARTGESALEHALRDPPRAAVVEHDLPDATGLDVMELLSAELGVKVVLTHAQQHLARPPSPDFAARAARAAACFPKPFRSLSLIEATARLVGHPARPVEGGPLVSGEGAPVDDGPLDLAGHEADPAPTTPPAPRPAAPADAAPPLRGFVEAEGARGAGDKGGLWRRAKEKSRASTLPVGDEAPASGEIALTPRALASMLDAFHQSQTTGEIWLQRGRARRVLLLVRGVIVGARSNIVGEEAATPRRVAMAAFTWTSGTMRATLDGRGKREPNPARVSVGDVILRGVLVTEAIEGLRAAAPDDARFAPNPESPYGLEELSLSPDEARIVVAMDGTKTVADLLTLFPDVGERTVRGLAAGLFVVGAVRFAGWGQASARRISFF